MSRKLVNIFEFFKSTLLVNFGVCAVIVLLSGFAYFFTIFLTFGFLMTIGFKELYRKNEYLFYSNNGISKLKLLLSSYLLSIVLVAFIWLIAFIIR